MSKKSSNEEPQKHKTPTEILEDLEKEKIAKERRKFVKEVLYPYLLAHSKSITDAKMMLKATAIGIQQAFNNKMVEEQKRLSDAKMCTLHMEEFIQKGEDFERFKGLLDLVKDESISVAASLLDGMETTINGFEKEEATKRNLSSLEATLLE